MFRLLVWCFEVVWIVKISTLGKDLRSIICFCVILSLMFWKSYSRCVMKIVFLLFDWSHELCDTVEFLGALASSVFAVFLAFKTYFYGIQITISDLISVCSLQLHYFLWYMLLKPKQCLKYQNLESILNNF